MTSPVRTSLKTASVKLLRLTGKCSIHHSSMYVRENCRKVDRSWVELVVLSMTTPPVLKTLHLLGTLTLVALLRQFPRRVAHSLRQVTKSEKSVHLLGRLSSCTASPLDCWNWKLQSFVCNHFQGYRTGSNLYCRKLFWRSERIVLCVLI